MKQLTIKDIREISDDTPVNVMFKQLYHYIGDLESIIEDLEAQTKLMKNYIKDLKNINTVNNMGDKDE